MKVCVCARFSVCWRASLKLVLVLHTAQSHTHQTHTPHLIRRRTWHFHDHSGQASGREEDDRILISPFNQNILCPVKRAGEGGGVGTNSQTFTLHQGPMRQLNNGNMARKLQICWRTHSFYQRSLNWGKNLFITISKRFHSLLCKHPNTWTDTHTPMW